MIKYNVPNVNYLYSQSFDNIKLQKQIDECLQLKSLNSEELFKSRVSDQVVNCHIKSSGVISYFCSDQCET